MGVGEGQPYPPQMSPEIRTRIIQLPAGPTPAHRAKAEFLAFLPSLSRTCSFFWFLSLQMASPLSLAPVRNLEAVLTPLSSTARSHERDCGRLAKCLGHWPTLFCPCGSGLIALPPGYPVCHRKYGPFMGFSAQKHLTAHQCKRQSDKANARSELQMAIIYLQFHGVPHTLSILDPSARECSQTGPHWRSHTSLTLENEVLYSLCLLPSSPVKIILDSTFSPHSLPL